MDAANIVYVLALLVGAVIVTVALLRIMKARARAHASAAPPPPATPAAAPEEEEYLDSSHILPGGTDAAARAAEAVRQVKGKPR